MKKLHPLALASALTLGIGPGIAAAQTYGMGYGDYDPGLNEVVGLNNTATLGLSTDLLNQHASNGSAPGVGVTGWAPTFGAGASFMGRSSHVYASLSYGYRDANYSFHSGALSGNDREQGNTFSGRLGWGISIARATLLTPYVLGQHVSGHVTVPSLVSGLPGGNSVSSTGFGGGLLLQFRTRPGTVISGDFSVASAHEHDNKNIAGIQFTAGNSPLTEKLSLLANQRVSEAIGVYGGIDIAHASGGSASSMQYGISTGIRVYF